ncbi:MAG: MBL fold metallo-hydrolase [Treponema sp.]|jgi:glyoxylase-like metal-dependent hydrolase (beta-lactamase superfamily II)|nr:MBL fold metallo-hydrolase [Treponema sp.]
MQLFKDVYLLSGHAYAMHPNVYGVVLPERQGLVLIDTGLNEEDLEIIEGNLVYWGLLDLRISHVLITHSHFDHAGNARHFRDKGAFIMAGEGDAQGIEAGDERTINYAYPMAFPPCRVDRIIRDGEKLELPGLDVHCHLVPGHSRGSVAYEANIRGKIILFTGDFLMAAPDCAYGRPGIPVGEDYDFAAYLSSLRRLRNVTVDAVLGGHGHPALARGSRIINSAYRNMLAERSFSNQKPL